MNADKRRLKNKPGYLLSSALIGGPFSFFRSLLEKPGEINGHADALAPIYGTGVLVDRKLHAAGNGVVFVNAEGRGPDEELAAPTARDIGARTLQSSEPLACAFGK